ncbi:MAG: hypothetical protein RLZZ49_1375 [Bacteroidota bacterium]|jgi:CBS domain-containing protein
MTFCSQLLDTSFQTFDLHDTVSHAMEMMDMHHAEYAVVLDGLNYLGLLDIVDLEEANPSSELIVLEQYFIPVLNEKNEWEGIIKADTLLEQTSLLLGASNTGAFIVLEIPRTAYAPGQINRLVESNDCMIMQLNTITDPLTGMLQLVIRVNKEEVSDLIATFQRHEYNVLYYYGEETFDNTLQNNLDHLLNYLNI